MFQPINKSLQYFIDCTGIINIAYRGVNTCKLPRHDTVIAVIAIFDNVLVVHSKTSATLYMIFEKYIIPRPFTCKPLEDNVYIFQYLTTKIVYDTRQNMAILSHGSEHASVDKHASNGWIEFLNYDPMILNKRPRYYIHRPSEIHDLDIVCQN